MIYFNLTILMLSAIWLFMSIDAGKNTEKALSALLTAVIVAAFTTGAGFPLDRAGLDWADMLHGKVTADLALNMFFSGALYAGVIGLFGLYVFGRLAKHDRCGRPYE